MGLKMRYTSTLGIEEGMIDVLDADAQGFVIDGCIFDDIPFLSPEEHKIALIAASKEHARKKAALTYNVELNQSREKGTRDSFNSDTDLSYHDVYDEVDGHELTTRERAAIERRVAEREAFISNEKYKQALLEHARLKQRELERAAENRQNNHVAKVKKTVSSSMKSHSTRLKTDITIINNTDKNVRVCWIDYRGNEIEYYNLARDERKKVNTFVGHCWVGRDTFDEVVFTAQVTKEHGQKIFCGKSFVFIREKQTPALVHMLQQQPALQYAAMHSKSGTQTACERPAALV